jgi:fructuronate reductase
VTGLSLGTLAGLPAAVARPAYDPADLPIGVVHLGIGAFHRAHQAWYLDQLAARPGAWGISGVSLRRPDMRDRLAPQDGLYTVIERDGDARRFRVVGTVREVLVAPENPAAVLARLTDPGTRLVTLTITEKGYCLDPATRRLDRNHPDLVADAADPSRPSSAIGYLIEALRRIRAAGGRPPTILPCDNLPSNGRVLHRALIDAAAATDEGLARWIGAEVVVPSTMVDRIVPAATAADLTEAAAALGIADAAAISTEPFTQWVIEDRGCPVVAALGTVGAELVTEVAPYERMKLRLLNGCHSAIAYLGLLAGHDYVYQSFGDPAIRRFIGAMQADELAPSVGHFPPEVLASYCAALARRWDNTAILHRTAQIAMDGSQKLPQRLLAPIAERLEHGLPVRSVTLAVAAWIRHLGAVNDAGAGIPVDDPLASRLMPLAAAGRSPDRVVADLLAVDAVFPASLGGNGEFKAMLTEALSQLARHGVQGVLAGR